VAATPQLPPPGGPPNTPPNTPPTTPPNAPPSRPTTRNPEETRARILAAALAEFSAKGIAGARVDRIAEAARTNKRMLYHYFGSKEGLYRAVLHQRLTERTPIADIETDEADRLGLLFERLADSRDYLRLLMWEALERGGETVEAEADRRDSLDRVVGRVRDAQAEGRAPGELDPRLLVLAELAMAAYPLAFPQVSRMLLDVDAEDAGFQATYAEFLRRLGERLGLAGPTAGAARPVAVADGDPASDAGAEAT
jgi:TetR/AcrR family transcriptional regulator